METSFSTIFFLACMIIIQIGHCYGQLKVGFYQGKCGNNDVEKVILDATRAKFMMEPDTVSDLVRLSFHDCFVRGCDGSVLLDGENTEKTAPVNQDLGGFDTVNDIKQDVENICPGVVSCSDVLAIGTRDVISLAGGQWYEVETGRRDGVVSLASEAQANLPPPDITILQSILLFAQKGLTISDMVTLLGGHTVGTAHCRSFKNRLYNYKNTKQPDPRISPPLLQTLRETCPLNSQANNEAFLDQTPNSHFTVDNAYYKQILANNGTLEIDANLASSPYTKLLVLYRSFSSSFFLTDFGKAVTKMARIGVLTGSQGEIRKTCGSIN